MQTPWTEGYADLLARWVKASGRYLYRLPDRPELLCYGAGDRGHWSVQTHLKAFSAFAVLSRLDIDFTQYGLNRETVRAQALAMLRYGLATHHTGNALCTDGGKWGHGWITVLGLERAMHGVEALDEFLTEADRALLRTVILSECDWLLNEYTITAGLVKNNRPESNIWNGAMLCRGAALCEDKVKAEAYTEKASAFFINGISTPADETEDAVCGGLPVRDRFVGANFHETLACNHHGYLNLGYMVICLSNIAMLHFSLKAGGRTLPEAALRRARDLWRLVRTMTCEDGRLLRIGGDSRARYCYCQDFALPVWAMAEDLFSEDCEHLIEGWLGILRTETGVEPGGLFLSARIGHLEPRTPVYYLRLESDRANSISMLLYWKMLHGFSGGAQPEPLAEWSDSWHGAAFTHTGGRYASFVWHASEKPQALCLPDDDSSLAEWRYNLCGRVEGAGCVNDEEILSHDLRMFPGGFVTSGRTAVISDDFLAEGQQRDTLAHRRLAFAALPDGVTVLGLQRACARSRAYVASVRGILWNLPNDIFNGSVRQLACESGSYTLRGGGHSRIPERIDAGRWVNADGRLGLCSPQPLCVLRPGRRQADIKGCPDSGTLYAEEICAPCLTIPRWYGPGEEIYAAGFAMNVGGADRTAALCRSLLCPPRVPGVDALGFVGADGHRYILYFNVSDAPVCFDPGEPLWDVAQSAVVSEAALPPGGAVLYRAV